MKKEELERSVALIISSDSRIKEDISNPGEHFGTGFVVHKYRDSNSNSTYLLTCYHVVQNVGKDKVIVYAKGQAHQPEVVACDETIDLAVLKVNRLLDIPVLKYDHSAEKGASFVTAGFFKVLPNKGPLNRSLQGTLGDYVTKPKGKEIKIWHLHIQDYELDHGYSGSPVVDSYSGNVIAVVIQKQKGGKSGLAISIEALKDIWQVVDKNCLYESLLKLGYEEQDRLFRKLVKHPVAGFLIHGLPSYGQRWLLKRLLRKHVTDCFRGRLVEIDLSRKVRKNDVSTLWIELGGWVGLQGKECVPGAIVERVSKWWQTENVLLIFEVVNSLPSAGLEQLIQEFWLPLATKARDSQVEGIPYKLLMFLVDHEGITASWDVPFADNIDASWQSYKPLKAKRLTKFSDDELTDWMDDKRKDLPTILTEDMDRVVQNILDESDDGIPEYTLRQICHLCLINWYDESKQWLKF